MLDSVSSFNEIANPALASALPATLPLDQRENGLCEKMCADCALAVFVVGRFVVQIRIDLALLERCREALCGNACVFARRLMQRSYSPVAPASRSTRSQTRAARNGFAAQIAW